MGWAGTSLEDRRAARRRRLLDTGLDLLGTQGAAAVSVREVCRRAGLTDRYVSESFADRDALLLAVYDEVAAEAGAALVAAVAGGGGFEQATRAAVEAFVDVLTADPRKGRVLLLEPLTDPVLGVRGVALSPAFAAIIEQRLPDAADAQLSATALVGALANLFIRWLDGTLAIERAELVDYCVRLLLAVTGDVGPGGVSSTPAPAAGRRRPRAGR